MALFENTKEDNKKTYIVILSKSGEVAGTVFPANNVPMDVMIKSLQDKGLTVEIRTSKSEVLELEL